MHLAKQKRRVDETCSNGISPAFPESFSSQSGPSTKVYPKLYGNSEDNFVEISLPKESKALLLVMRIRNEAKQIRDYISQETYDLKV